MPALKNNYLPNLSDVGKLSGKVGFLSFNFMKQFLIFQDNKMQLKKPLKKPIFFSRKMKTGAWYVAGFVIAFVYFYVYAVNYIRGVRADEIELDPVTNIQDFHQRLRRQSGKFVYK